MLQSYGYIFTIAGMMDNGLRRWHFPKTFLYSTYKKLFFTDFMGTLYAARGRRRSVLLMKAVKCYNYIVLVTDEYSMNVEQ